MRTWSMLAFATLLGVLPLTLIPVAGLEGMAVLLVSNGVQLFAAVAACLGCLVAARRTSRQRRSAWAWLAAGTGSWAAGQLVWSFYEIVLAREVPFPSLADLGFILFPVLAGLGLIRWLGTQQHQLMARGRDLLDGAIIAASLLIVSWVTTLSTVVEVGAESWVPLSLSVAYPVGDLVLATLVLLALIRSDRHDRATLAGMALGLGGLAFADSAYVYLVAIGSYTSADLVSGGWVLGFAWVAASGFSVRPSPDVSMPAGASAVVESAEAGVGSATLSRSLIQLLLPYAALAVAAVALGHQLLRADGARNAALLLGLGLVLLVIARQLVELVDNQRLLSELAEARDQLASQTLHDPLTGLANRVLLLDRLDRALLRRCGSVSVLFCDLDDFKLVNDQYGHDVGDELLMQVAARMLSCVRATDTVARIGGDEFVIVLEDSSEAEAIATRVVAMMTRPVLVRGHELRVTISVGLTHHELTPDDSSQTVTVQENLVRATTGNVVADDAALPPIGTAYDPATGPHLMPAALLKRADQAMYAAKGAGKGRAVLGNGALPRHDL